MPVPFADALLLTPIEISLVNGLSRIYGISKNEESKQFFNSIVEVGTVSVAAKTLLSALKAIPGINLGASVLNAIIAGSIVGALGEGSIFAFEQVFLGKKSVSDIIWVQKVIEEKLSPKLKETIKAIVEQISANPNKNDIGGVITEAIKALFNKENIQKV